jgi:hypothetical protein
VRSNDRTAGSLKSIVAIENLQHEQGAKYETRGDGAKFRGVGGIVISSFGFGLLATLGTMVRRSCFIAQLETQSQQRSSLRNGKTGIRLLHDAAPHRHARTTMKMGHWPDDSHFSLVTWPSVFWVSRGGSIRANHFITNVWSLSEYLSRSSKASPSIKSLT